MMLASGGDPLQLTHDEGDKLVDSFSPDGTEIFYQRSMGQDEEWAVPTLGGTPHRVASGRSLVAAPDGSAFFYLKSASRAIFRAGRSGLSEEVVYSFDQPALEPVSILVFPGVSDLLVQTRAQLGSEEAQLHRLSLSSRTVLSLGSLSGYPSDPAWGEPGKTVLFSRTVNGLMNLWTYHLDTRALKQMTSGAGPDFSPMADPGGKGIYYVNGKQSGSLINYRVQTGVSTEIVSEDASQPSISPDGKRVAYLKFREAGKSDLKSELWVSDLDGGNKTRLASAALLVTGDWSFDSARFVFMENTPKQNKAYIVRADGRDLRQVDRVAGWIGWIAWSRDGETIYLSSNEGDSKRMIWKASSTGFGVEQLLKDGCTVTDVAPDGKHLLCFNSSGADVGIYQVSIGDKKVVPLLPGVETFGLKVARDGKSFLYPVAGRGELTFYRQVWQEGRLVGKPQVALRLPFALPLLYRGNALDFSRDLSTIVYARPGGQADLYLLSQTE